VKLTFILWRGDIGGAERVTLELAGTLKRQGIETHIVFIEDSGMLGPQLERHGLEHSSLGLARGSRLLAHPRQLARSVTRQGTDAAFVMHIGYAGLALRLGGFSGTMVGVDHGTLLRLRDGRAGLLRRAERTVAVPAYDAEVAVSGYMAALVQNFPHAPVRLVSYGVAPPSQAPALPDSSELVVGYVGRHFPGKGVNQLLRALAILRDGGAAPVRARIAGDGDARFEWERLARELRVADSVEFTGWIDDVTRHWEGCHLAIAPNDTFVESFCISIAEAMSCGRPPVVTDRGALPYLVEPGVAGEVVPAGDARALAAAIGAYADDRPRIVREGAAARAKAMESYSLDAMARGYRDVAAAARERRSSSERPPVWRAFRAGRSHPRDL
jgi:glycosyltransferase involved in cell wall biosynthesis